MSTPSAGAHPFKTPLHSQQEEMLGSVGERGKERKQEREGQRYLPATELSGHRGKSKGPKTPLRLKFAHLFKGLSFAVNTHQHFHKI